MATGAKRGWPRGWPWGWPRGGGEIATLVKIDLKGIFFKIVGKVGLKDLQKFKTMEMSR